MEKIVIPLIFVAFATLEAIKTGFFNKKGQTRSDAIVEIVSAFVLIGITQPLVLFAGLCNSFRSSIQIGRS